MTARPTPARRAQRGISLIEALVAFGVMAFGMLAVIGLQATLRGNGDLARQRAEAVRIAQDAIEEWRGFSTLVTTTNRTAYADIAGGNVDVVGTNATYTVRRSVPSNTVVTGTVTPERRTVVVDVEWRDRQGQTQSLRLNSVIAGIEPELAASLVLGSNGESLLAPRGRNRGIPATAVQLGNGSSGYVPPGQTGGGDRVAWVFNNVSGVITLCTTPALTSAQLLLSGNAPVCSTNKALLLSGVVRFNTTNTGQPSDASFNNPTGPLFPSVGITVAQTAPGSPQTVTCFQDALENSLIPYACALPITTLTPNWSGSISFTAPTMAATLATADPTLFKVCRYFSALSYSAVTTALLNQNFVIIRAGSGGVPYRCYPTATPAVYPHQPAT